MKAKRKILGVTGIRSEYDIMSSVFKAIQDHPELELEIAVTGAHLSDAFGYTVDDIKADGFKIADEIESLLNSDQASARVKSLAIQLQGLIQTIIRVKPDFLLVLGDREESMNTALAGAYMNIPVAHIAGGDRVVGNVDDQIRHAVTKLSHLHLVTSQDSFERVLKLGEQKFRVHNVGNPGLDRILKIPVLSSIELSKQLGFEVKDNEPLILLIQHAISTEIEDAYTQMKETLEAVKALKIKTIVSFPNSDAGGQQIIKAIQEYQHLDFLYSAKNIPRVAFINIMRRASCMLGNSSAGIVEAPLLKLPVINVGNRQKGRLHAENVVFVPHKSADIQSAIKQAIFDLDYLEKMKNCTNPYGDGQSSVRIAELLASTQIDENFMIKDMTY